MTILIKNGTLVTASSTGIADILIEDDRIKLIGTNISEKTADKVIDARGMYILPGGVDPHVHMHLPGAAGYSSDDFQSGSRAALFGGTTTLIDFVTPGRGESLTDALAKREGEAQNSLADYSFHVSPVEWRNSTATEIDGCIKLGITSFKIYMAYKNTIGLDDQDIEKVLQTVAMAGGIVTVHCETGDEIEELRAKYFNNNNTAPVYHALSRPAVCEVAAVEKIISLAGKAGCPLYIVHVSAGGSLKHIRKAQSAGQKVFAETCPQYLLLDQTRYRGKFSQTVPFVISPPLRSRKDNEALWDAIADKTISTVGTDHCPFTFSQKLAGANDFRKIPNGAGGVEHRLQLLYTYGVMKGKISINHMVDLFSTQPAKIFGLYPKKGAIEPGSDADIVIWDPDSENIITTSSHHQNCDINIYEGFSVKGSVRYVIAGGKIVIQDEVMIEPEIRGKFLKRLAF
jgi:dihydropyrimidinase